MVTAWLARHAGCNESPVKTVLVVDDIADIRDLAALVLRDAGYAVREASNGEEALAILATMQVAPCLILLDLMMPVMDGLTLVERLREQGSLIPVVIVSATVSERVAGVLLTVRKPVSPDALRAIVCEHCGGARR